MVRGAAVIANSRYTADLIVDRYGTAAERIVVIPRGTDLDALRSEDSRSGAPQRASARPGGIRPRQADRPQPRAAHRLEGPARADRGCRAAAARRTRRHLSSCWPAMRRAATSTGWSSSGSSRRRGFSERVRIVGHCDDAPAALALADVAVIASTEPEAFGRTAIEAAAMGVPVVATALGATAETVLAPPHCPAAERTGWLVPARRCGGTGGGDRRGADRFRRSERGAPRRSGATPCGKLRHADNAGRDARPLRPSAGTGPATPTASRNDKPRGELTCRRIRRILHFAVAALAGAPYVYPSATT